METPQSSKRPSRLSDRKRERQQFREQSLMHSITSYKHPQTHKAHRNRKTSSSYTTYSASILQRRKSDKQPRFSPPRSAIWKQLLARLRMQPEQLKSRHPSYQPLPLPIPLRRPLPHQHTQKQQEGTPDQNQLTLTLAHPSKNARTPTPRLV